MKGPKAMFKSLGLTFGQWKALKFLSNAAMWNYWDLQFLWLRWGDELKEKKSRETNMAAMAINTGKR